jgi:transposase-like protein
MESEEIMSNPMTPDRIEEASLLSPTCPLCHTLDTTVTSDSLRGGAEWACTRCGQTWSAARLATAAAYARYEVIARIPGVAA